MKNNMKSICLLAVTAFFLFPNCYCMGQESTSETAHGAAASNHAVTPFVCENAASQENLAKHPFVFDFMGKSDRAPWDIGVIAAAREMSPRIQSGEVIYAGNSSGAILAAYFSCWGVTASSIAELKAIMNEHMSKSELQFDQKYTIKKLVLNKTFGTSLPLERDHAFIGQMIDSLLEKKDSAGKKITCDPKTDIIISSANLDVLDVRKYKEGKEPNIPFWNANQTGADPTNASPNPMLYESLEGHTAEMNTFDVTKDGKQIGKGCTYFVTRDLFDKLRKLDRKDRQCELRLIETLDDLKLAIHASVAEPTYFEPQVDPEPEKIVGGILQPGTRRVYNGGYLVSPLGKDLKKLDPKTLVIGTGVHPFSDKVDNLLKTWFLISPNESLAIQKKFLDAEVLDSWGWDEKPLAEDLIKAGHEKAKEVLGKLKQECRLP